MRRVLIAAAAAAALAVPVSSVAATPSLQVVAWATHARPKTNVPPPDAFRGPAACQPHAVRQLYAFVRFHGMRNKLPSTATWYFDGKKVFVFRFKWEDGATGRTAFDIRRTKGLLETGRYRVEVRLGTRLAGSGEIQLKFGSC